MNLVLACLMLLVHDVLGADELVLTDGTRLVGTLVSWTRAEIVLRTSSGEMRALVPEQIARVHLGRRGITTVAARLSESPRAERAPYHLAPAPSQAERAWTGAFDVSYAGHRGTADSDSLVLEFRSERRRDPVRLRLRSRYFYALKNRSLAGNEWLGGGRVDRYFSPRFFLSASGDFEFDEIERVNLRSIYSIGFGYDLLASERQSLSLSAGSGYTRESFRGGERRDFLSGVFRQEFRRRLSARSQLEQQFHLLQDLRAAARFKFRLDGLLRVRVSEFFTIRVGVSDAYDHRPQPGVRRNEVTFTTGLGFVF